MDTPMLIDIIVQIAGYGWPGTPPSNWGLNPSERSKLAVSWSLNPSERSKLVDAVKEKDPDIRQNKVFKILTKPGLLILPAKWELTKQDMIGLLLNEYGG